MHVVIPDGAYRFIDPREAVPSSDSFLVRQIGKGDFVVQAN
jgi:hypothetical protein